MRFFTSSDSSSAEGSSEAGPLTATIPSPTVSIFGKAETGAGSSVRVLSSGLAAAGAKGLTNCRRGIADTGAGAGSSGAGAFTSFTGSDGAFSGTAAEGSSDSGGMEIGG